MKSIIDNRMISCVIPTYKRCDSLGRAIDSVLAQTYDNLEVLVVDDNERGSQESQAVKDLLANYTDPRVKYVEQEKHINGAEARNAGVRASKGEYIAFLDDDDEWLPEKLEKQMNFLSTHPEVDGVSCLYNEYSKGVLFHSCPPYTCDNIHKKIFQRDVAVFTSTVLLNKEKLLKAGLFDNSLRRHQDLQLLLDFTKENKFDVLPEYLVKLHSDSDINRPSFDKLVNIKEMFFNSVSEQFALYSPREQREIKAAHYFELAFAALKEKKYGVFLKYIAKVGFNFKAYKNVINRFKGRKYINS